MVDTVVRPASHDPNIWHIEEQSAAQQPLGQIARIGDGFFVFASKDSLLENTQISRGPYRSQHDAMDAIAAKLGGFCTASEP